MKRKFCCIVFCCIVLCCVVSSCASAPFKVDSVPAASLSEKTIFLGIQAAEWNKAIIPLIDAGIYNSGLNKIIEEYSLQEAQRVELMEKEVADYYQSIYNTEFSFVNFPVDKSELSLDFFSNPSDETRQTIANICKEQNAEYAFGIIGRMATTKVLPFGITAWTMLFFHTALFDKEGNIISKGTANSEQYKINANDVERFISLFDEAENSLKSLISAMGQ